MCYPLISPHRVILHLVASFGFQNFIQGRQELSQNTTPTRPDGHTPSCIPRKNLLNRYIKSTLPTPPPRVVHSHDDSSALLLVWRLHIYPSSELCCTHPLSQFPFCGSFPSTATTVLVISSCCCSPTAASWTGRSSPPPPPPVFVQRGGQHAFHYTGCCGSRYRDAVPRQECGR